MRNMKAMVWGLGVGIGIRRTWTVKVNLDLLELTSLPPPSTSLFIFFFPIQPGVFRFFHWYPRNWIICLQDFRSWSSRCLHHQQRQFFSFNFDLFLHCSSFGWICLCCSSLNLPNFLDNFLTFKATRIILSRITLRMFGHFS